MADPRAAWLALQRDLGGDEVILDSPVTPDLAPTQPLRRSARSNPVEPVNEPEVGPASTSPVESPWRAKEYPDGEAPSWAIGAPAIPERGLDVRLPSAANVTTRWETLDAIAASIAECTACPLCQGRTNTVPGAGNPTAELMVIGEGPGEQEDLSGLPFVGRAGELLNKMLESIDLPREQVFVANVVKCRPPRNRAPLPDERDACLPYLQRQIALVRPRVILVLGKTAAEALLGVKDPLSALRLKVHTLDATPLVVTYHPAALLRNPNWKRPTWDDLRIARQLVDARR